MLAARASAECGLDIRQPRLDIGDPVCIGGRFGLFEQRQPFGVGLHARCRSAAPAVPGASWATWPMRAFLGEVNRTGFRRQITGNHPEQRRLSRTVAADKTRLRALRQRQRRMVDQQAPGHAGGKVGQGQHGRLLEREAADGKRKMRCGRCRIQRCI